MCCFAITAMCMAVWPWSRSSAAASSPGCCRRREEVVGKSPLSSDRRRAGTEADSAALGALPIAQM